jgi:hypothetical protein
LARNTCLLVTGNPPAVVGLRERDGSPTLKIVVRARARFSAHYQRITGVELLSIRPVNELS